MSQLHDNPPSELDGVPVVKIEDYFKQVSIVGKKETPISLPKSDLVKLYFSDGNTICVRPSGTEPKVKFYFGIVGKDQKSAEEKPDILYKHFKEKLGL
jgi:phosphoglucomutase